MTVKIKGNLAKQMQLLNGRVSSGKVAATGNEATLPGRGKLKRKNRPPPPLPWVGFTPSSLVARTTSLSPHRTGPLQKKRKGGCCPLASCLPTCPASRVASAATASRPPPPSSLRSSVALCGREGGWLRRGPLPSLKGMILPCLCSGPVRFCRLGLGLCDPF